MKEALITKLRDRKSSREAFRLATEQLSLLLAGEAGSKVKSTPITVHTPLEMTEGELLNDKVTIIPILRAGLAMLSPFLRYFPLADVGFFGMRRDETRKQPFLYYENIPDISPDHNVIIIDPMIATGGSASLALKKVLERGISDENIVYVGIVAAPQGIEAIKMVAPKAHIIVAQHDEELNNDAFIVPGIGDFGDRYFGTD